jgi:hypothetical protein
LAPNWILREVLDTVLRMRPKVELVVSGSGEFGAIGGVEEPDQAAGYFGKRRSIAARLHPVQFAVYWLTLLTVLGEASFRGNVYRPVSASSIYRGATMGPKCLATTEEH